MLKRIRWQIAQFFELNWWKSYLKNRSVEDYLSWKRKYWSDFLSSLGFSESDFAKGDLSLLDIGCGPAGIFSIFPNKNMTAVDPLIEKYQNELAHFKQANYPAVSFIPSSLEAFNTKQKFDAVFCLNCINHVLDINKSMEKLYSLCNANATLIISTDAHHNNFLKKIFKLIPGDVLHPHQYNKEEYLQIFEKAGFILVKELKLKHESIFHYWVFVMKKV